MLTQQKLIAVTQRFINYLLMSFILTYTVGKIIPVLN
jgi:hypothetical protein